MSTSAISYDGSNPVRTTHLLGDGTVTTSQKSATAVDSTVSDIIERRNQSRDYMVANYYDELVETYRAIKCRTKPFLKIDNNGKEVEDKSRTNVAMPDLNIIFRRNAARMTAQPYKLRYIGGSDPLIAQLLTAQAALQYDRTNEGRHDRRVVMGAEAFGFSYSKLYWDNIEPTRVFRKALMRGNQVVFNDRASVMGAQGAPQDEIQSAVQEYGQFLTPEEVAEFIGKSGNEIILPTKVKRYEGPVVKSLFVGDVFIEPGTLCLDDSGYVIEQYTETDLWLQKMLKVTYTDDNGSTIQAFDSKAAQELLDMDPGPEMPGSKISDLREMFRDITKQTQPWIPKRLLPGKRFDIIECHELGDDGRMWITWCSEHLRDKALGRMPYPWDLYGKYTYTELVPLPDLVNAQGDSTPRLLRYVHLLLNYTFGQNFDYVTNLLSKFLLVRDKEDGADEVINRGPFRELRCKDPSNFQYLQDPPLPTGAFERGAELWRVLGLAEPSVNGVDAGTATNPQAGKTATTAMLAAKSFDGLTQFKLDGRNLYLRELGQKKLWMNQQAARESWEIASNFWTQELREMLSRASPDQLNAPASFDDDNNALPRAVNFDATKQSPEQWVTTSRYGKAAAVRLDPMDIQEEYEVEPEAGSYLAVDDDLRRAAAMDLEQVAMAAPDVVDHRKVVRFHLSTIRGIGNPDDYIIPENPNPQPPPFKGNIGVNLPLDKMPSDVVNQILPMFGLQPSAELAHRDTMDAVGRMSEAADHASNLLSPADKADEAQDIVTAAPKAMQTRVGNV